MAALEEPPEVATTGEASELPYDGDISAAMKAQDRAAIKVIMEARKNQKGKSPVKDASAAEEQDGEGGSAAAASAAEQKLCPICSEMRDDVELLEHATNIKGDISDHQVLAARHMSHAARFTQCPCITRNLTLTPPRLAAIAEPT